MPLSWNEIRERAIAFTREWKDESSESAEAKSFWDAFFNVFGIPRKRIATFEEPVKTLKQTLGRIDLLWKGMLLVEHKSRGKDLTSAYRQALDYTLGLKAHELPRYILVSDFARLRLYDLEEDETTEFAIEDLHKNIEHFGFIAGYTKQTFEVEDAANIVAAEKMGKLHDALLESGYGGHSLEQFLVRLLFCFFADDTGIFDPGVFGQYIRERTGEDGSNLGSHIAHIFQVLDTDVDGRNANLDEDLQAFPYVNGGLFEETLPIASFNASMRAAVLECSRFDWSQISPAIFGSMFQSVMDDDRRRNLGAHYTSEKNILKLIRPLFLDELEAELAHLLALKGRGRKKRLEDFHTKLANMRFFDPACGCGNFLVITYRELRRLELEILTDLHMGKRETQQAFRVDLLSRVNVDQMFGIEIEEFPAKIAETALWLTDHQANEQLSITFGRNFARIPLEKSPHILHANALTTNWQDFVPPGQINYILGNPPFGGARVQNAEQKAEIKTLFRGMRGYGAMDYVTGWYIKAAQYVQGTEIKVAFVSTNSIAQGEQVGILWGELFGHYKLHIHFAHRTFQWRNEARGNAAVHCVIIGFANVVPTTKTIYEYQDIRGEPHQQDAANITPYLIDGPEVLVTKRGTPLCSVPGMGIGNKPIDGGNYLFDNEAKAAFLAKEPKAVDFLCPWIGATQFLYGTKRWVLFLKHARPEDLRRMPLVLERVAAVREFRLASKSAPTQKLASTPTLFHVEMLPDSDYLLIPRHSSENRQYIPFGFFTKDSIVGDSCLAIPDATLYHFGMLSSSMHMAWVRTVCGRLKSDFRYSKDIVYNNYPWPKDVSNNARAKVEQCGQGVLDARGLYPDSSLADLYDPLTMPPELVAAHGKLDAAVDGAYGRRKFNTEMERLSYLFELYEQYTAPLTAKKAKKRRRKTS